MMIIAGAVVWFFLAQASDRRVTANELTEIFSDRVTAEAFKQVADPITASGEVAWVTIDEGVPVVEFRTAEGWVRAELPKRERWRKQAALNKGTSRP